mmetsp:Transcript_40535/g.48624  ORF Transcript_40535/g.48624 Transcript_40535/m.48624 type:complete len:81 (-) Transcript_40535:413-655(-)
MFEHPLHIRAGCDIHVFDAGGDSEREGWNWTRLSPLPQANRSISHTVPRSIPTNRITTTTTTTRDTSSGPSAQEAVMQSI